MLSHAAVRTIAPFVEAVAALKAHTTWQNDERLKAKVPWSDHGQVFTRARGT